VVAESLVVRAARWAEALEQEVRTFVMAGDQTLGDIELEIEQQSRELLRTAAEKAAQTKADRTPPVCPVCQKPLSQVSTDHRRSFECKFGTITIGRGRGYCKRCRKWRFPADTVLGLEDTAGYSPRVQEMAALLASKMPVGEASAVLEHLTGVKLPPATLDREARRQGKRAQQVRRQADEQACQAKAVQSELVLEPYQMIIQLDAWNIRERDQWGQTGQLRRKGQEPQRWHWVYTGTCFRLDQRGKTAGGRPLISQRGFVATREGMDGLREQLYAEALRRGLGQAAGVLVIGDGALWIWRLADDRFKEARQRLDFYHAVQHLAAVGRALYGEDPAKFQGWLRPLVHERDRTFGVVLDTSGSMSSTLMGRALGAIASYAAARDVPAARVVFCDAVAYDAGYLAVHDIAGRVRVQGRGGTILQPGIDLLERASDFPSAGPILIITDGYCDVLRVRREHAYLIPRGSRLPFTPKGEVFRFR